MDKCAFIVPERDRENHLAVYSQKMVEYITAISLSAHIFIIHQDNDLPFNRGKLLNIGAALSGEEFQYFCFQDVDTIPCNTNVDFSFPNHPRQLFGMTHSFGAVALISRADFFSVDGFSNLYEGWGREDVDFADRLHKAGIPLDLSKTNENVGIEERAAQIHSTIVGNFEVLPHPPTLLVEKFGVNGATNLMKKDITEVAKVFKESYDSSKNVQLYQKKWKDGEYSEPDGLSSLKFVVHGKKQSNFITEYFVSWTAQ